ncbi:MAG: BON domain-containing protein [bacterium]|jgi:osmotically-inducible protein OsmY|nr:BON domain-containing protein [bacterium]
MKLHRLLLLLLVVAMSVSFVGCASSQKKAVNDQAIADQIKAQLESELGPEGPFSIDIFVDKGVVTLDGKVKDNAAKEKALTTAQTTQGVKDVKSFVIIQ